MKKISLALAVFCLSLVTACGWHLRGSLNLPADLTSIDIQGASPALKDALVRQLEANGVSVSSNSPYTLAVSDERQESRTAALGSDALAAQYEYTSSAQFEFRNQGGQLIGTPGQVQVMRTVNFDSGEVLGSASEGNLVRGEMTQDLASQLIRRLSFLARTAAKDANGTPAP
ncbi:LPS assembly lipoprotein LptE [Simiduia aestuariiviva]|uniref:LPS-assembly lipoprotein LptE n=1 Tax=Simiduia aestuariiviva TaxID=1510459 RepID=A0A839UV33_9GAMM|nr:LPS assembly lipoprotein LptE [Simiduia aestuariiviva]MBB3169215.1 LPS-assembly lipoprotein [Simiduia aestuariiviva]